MIYPILKQAVKYFDHLKQVLKNVKSQGHAFLLNRGIISCFSACQCDSHLQEGLQGGSGGLQACQLDLDARKGCGTVFSYNVTF